MNLVRYGMLIDLNSCIGCRVCMTACKCNHDIPVGEYEGREYYRIWPKEVEMGVYPYVVRNFTPLLCMHCEFPPCLEACPISGAIYKRKDGVVLVDEKKCNGCRLCIQACPYDAIYFRGDKGVVDKCTFCIDLTDNKLHLQPECVKTCPSDAMFFGDIDNPESKVSKLIKKYNAKQLHPTYGTNPSIYYTSHAGRIRGIVWNPQAQMPVHRAKVKLNELDPYSIKTYNTIADVEGVFFFWKLSTHEKYKLEIEAKGYIVKNIMIELLGEYLDLGKILMKEL